MTSVESLERAESELMQAERLLGDVRPEAVERCNQLLSRAADIFGCLSSSPAGPHDPAMTAVLIRIRAGAARIQSRIDHASNLVRGWRQMKFASGYTRCGQPEFAEESGGRSFEV
jgi:hypothetical protein